MRLCSALLPVGATATIFIKETLNISGFFVLRGHSQSFSNDQDSILNSKKIFRFFSIDLLHFSVQQTRPERQNSRWIVSHKGRSLTSEPDGTEATSIREEGNISAEAEQVSSLSRKQQQQKKTFSPSSMRCISPAIDIAFSRANIYLSLPLFFKKKKKKRKKNNHHSIALHCIAKKGFLRKLDSHTAMRCNANKRPPPLAGQEDGWMAGVTHHRRRIVLNVSSG